MASVYKRSRHVCARDWTDPATGKAWRKGQKCPATLPVAKRTYSRFYTIELELPGGKVRREKAGCDLKAARARAADLQKAVERGAAGLVDTFKVHRRTPLTSHLADWDADLAAKGRSALYRQNVGNRLRKLFGDLGWAVLGDVTADGFCRWRETPIERKEAKPHGGRIGPRTSNQYLEALRSFLNWCIRRERWPSNPVVHVERMKESADVRRTRRALAAEDLVKFFAVLAADDRRVYHFILSTGLRRSEVDQLRWGDVRLDAVRPFLQLRAAATKSGRPDPLPLRVDLAAELKAMWQERAAADGAAPADAEPVFPAGVPSMDRHRAYLAKAQIPWLDDDGRRADVHALRHTYGTLLSASGASPREAMELMRHTDLRLTMRFYTDPRLFDLAGRVDNLPLPAPTAKPAGQTGPARAGGGGTAG